MSSSLLDAAEVDSEAISALYASVWPDRPDFATRQLPLHLARPGFTLALSPSRGFAYGYTGARGQYWTDIVASRMTPDAAATWLGAHFEFVELAVTPQAQGRGIGRQLATTLLNSRTESRSLLQVAATNAPARALYESLGFREVAHLGAQLFLGKVLT